MIEVNKEDDLFEDIELQTPENTDTRAKDVVVSDGPSVTSPEWNDYVLGLFEDNEMYDGRPLCAGLRRVAELLLGQIVSSKPTQVFPPMGGNEIGRATVIWELVFSNGMTFSDVADSWEGNTDDTFCVFNTATAATRAEGRALRKALRLKTVAAEEMTKKNTASIVRSISQTKEMENTEGEYEDNSRMSDAQANFINVKCDPSEAKGLNIDVIKFFKQVFDVNVKRKVTKGQASDAIKKLNAYQKNKNSIPEGISGYNPDWRN
jgi:hypothetical protein